MNLSTWLTVLETTRNSGTHFDEFITYAKSKYTALYDTDLFDTTGDRLGFFEGTTTSKRAELLKKRPKSVLLNKRDQMI